MKRAKLDIKDEYSGEEALDLIRETLFQISQDLDDELYDLKDEIAEERDSLIEAGLEREKNQLKNDRNLVDQYYSETTKEWLTECCDAELESYSIGRKQCSECKQDTPHAYPRQLEIQDFIKLLNNKIEQRNQE